MKDAREDLMEIISNEMHTLVTVPNLHYSPKDLLSDKGLEIAAHVIDDLSPFKLRAFCTEDKPLPYQPIYGMPNSRLSSVVQARLKTMSDLLKIDDRYPIMDRYLSLLVGLDYATMVESASYTPVFKYTKALARINRLIVDLKSKQNTLHEVMLTTEFKSKICLLSKFDIYQMLGIDLDKEDEYTKTAILETLSIEITIRPNTDLTIRFKEMNKVVLKVKLN